MNPTTALTTTTHGPATWGYMGSDMESAGKLAKALVGTGLAPSGMTAGQAFYVMLAGAELGLRGPIEALRHVVVIKGKPSISAELMRSMMLQAGCKLDWLRTDSTGATLKITRPDGSSGTFTFDEADAKRAGLTGNNTWKSYPNAMYQARVTSLAARAFCPDMLRGASYTPDELGVRMTVTGEGDIVPEPAREVESDHDDDPKPSGGKALPAPNGNGGEVASRLPEDPVASSAQVKALAILATKKLGGIPRGDRLRIYEAILQREVETSADVTVSEWRQLVDALNQMSDKAVAPGEGTPTSEAETAGAGEGVRGTAHDPAPDGGLDPEAVAETDRELWGKDGALEPDWSKLTKEQKALRDKVVRLAKSVEWINVEDKTVLCPAPVREMFVADPGPYIDPARIVTRPVPTRAVALYEECVETERAARTAR